jgi:hypothetical protein
VGFKSYASGQAQVQNSPAIPGVVGTGTSAMILRVGRQLDVGGLFNFLSARQVRSMRRDRRRSTWTWLASLSSYPVKLDSGTVPPGIMTAARTHPIQQQISVHG